MIDQIGIGLFGATGIILVTLKSPKYRMWGCIFGLMAQPFWVYTSWTNSQWAVFGLTIIYSISWVNGWRNNIKLIQKENTC